MKEKSFFSRLFGGGAEAQKPRISSARREELAEELLPHLQKSDPVWDAIQSWTASMYRDKIAERRDNADLPKAVEYVVRQCASVEVVNALHSYGVSVFNSEDLAKVILETVKNALLDGDKAWLIRADKRDSSKLSEKEREFFAAYFAEKGGVL